MNSIWKNAKVSDELKEQAEKEGVLCQPWRDDWKTRKNLDELCEMFIKGIKVCAYHHYPAPEYIEHKFGKTALSHGIYANRQIEAVNPNIIVAKGTSSGNITFGGFSFGVVHALDQSALNITVKDNAIVWVYVYNNASVNIDSSSVNYVRVHRYEGKVLYTGKVDIRKRKYNLHLTEKEA